VKLLDANVFIYSRGRVSPYRDPCIAIFEHAGQDPAAYGVDVETLQELLDVYARRGERTFGARAVEEALSIFPDPFPITRKEVEEAVDALKGYRRLSPRDAIHAAVVLRTASRGS
jgi:predicted nucleic acid-binding protein